jgi:hypothetical protein
VENAIEETFVAPAEIREHPDFMYVGLSQESGRMVFRFNRGGVKRSLPQALRYVRQFPAATFTELAGRSMDYGRSSRSGDADE